MPLGWLIKHGQPWHKFTQWLHTSHDKRKSCMSVWVASDKILMTFLTTPLYWTHQYLHAHTYIPLTNPNIPLAPSHTTPHTHTRTFSDGSLLEHSFECMVDVWEGGAVSRVPQPTLLHQLIHSHWTPLGAVHPVGEGGTITAGTPTVFVPHYYKHSCCVFVYFITISNFIFPLIVQRRNGTVYNYWDLWAIQQFIYLFCGWTDSVLLSPFLASIFVGSKGISLIFLSTIIVIRAYQFATLDIINLQFLMNRYLLTAK